jgi:hypothetical protein
MWVQVELMPVETVAQAGLIQSHSCKLGELLHLVVTLLELLATAEAMVDQVPVHRTLEAAELEAIQAMVVRAALVALLVAQAHLRLALAALAAAAAVQVNFGAGQAVAESAY